MDLKPLDYLSSKVSCVENQSCRFSKLVQSEARLRSSSHTPLRCLPLFLSSFLVIVSKVVLAFLRGTLLFFDIFWHGSTCDCSPVLKLRFYTNTAVCQQSTFFKKRAKTMLETEKGKEDDAAKNHDHRPKSWQWIMSKTKMRAM